MNGKTFIYNAQTVKVLSHKFDGEYCTVATTGQWISRPNAELLKLLDDFLETEEEPSVAVEVYRPEVKTVETFKDLTAILMDNIKKVQEDKGYVDQAQQVSLSVKMIIDVAKTEIEAVKAVNDIVRNR